MKPRPAHDPNSPTRHKPFQFGTNPMLEDSFEKKLLLQERMDRKRVQMKQIYGMQGVDGGRCYDRMVDGGETF